MTEPIPKRVRALADQRAAARSARSFIEADALRDELLSLGWQVHDRVDGYDLQPAPIYERVDPATVESVLDDPATERISLHLLHEGFIEDLERFLVALVKHHDLSGVETIVVDPATDDAEAIEALVRTVPGARALHLDRDPGWAAARNAGLKTARGGIVVLADLSIEPAGDILSPLADALDLDNDLAITGPVGVVTSDLRTWQEATTPVADAIEGYLLATRRDLLRDTGLINERFTWYRNADLDLSLQVRNEHGGSARVTDVPIVRQMHRGYVLYPDEAERERRSRRNYNVFLDRWRDARYLLTGA